MFLNQFGISFTCKLTFCLCQIRTNATVFRVLPYPYIILILQEFNFQPRLKITDFFINLISCTRLQVSENEGSNGGKQPMTYTEYIKFILNLNK